MKLSTVLTALVVSAVMGGCAYGPGKVTGGGFLQGSGGEGTKANFGFNASGCEAYQVFPGYWAGVSGQFNFHDKTAPTVGGKNGVMLNGEVVGVVECLKAKDECLKCFVDSYEGDYMIEVIYRSTNPFNPGEGTAYVCARDNGEGLAARTAAPDYLWMKVTSGPYAGYKTKGVIQGNIQGHPCDQE